MCSPSAVAAEALQGGFQETGHRLQIQQKGSTQSNGVKATETIRDRKSSRGGIAR